MDGKKPSSGRIKHFFSLFRSEGGEKEVTNFLQKKKYFIYNLIKIHK